jgi:S-adenosyl-L-methionine hydrolase (adenosine-forming)
LVGPDNGILSQAFPDSEPEAVYHLTNASFFLDHVSHTFHGRDIFAPAAAHVSLGEQPESMGTRLHDWVRIRLPQPAIKPGYIEGEVMHLDRFGNLITNIRREHLKTAKMKESEVEIEVAGIKLANLKDIYAQARNEEFLGLIGSNGYMEIARNKGNAAQELKAVPGLPVYVYGKKARGAS